MSVKMPGKIEEWPIERLIPYVRNPRRNDHAVDRMAAAIAEFGFRMPVLARSDGTLVDGHLRLKAALKLGIASVPVVLADDLSEAQIMAFRLIINRSATWADWDEDLLSNELANLAEMDFDMSGFGFYDLPNEQEKESRVVELDFSDIQDTFWINVSGPLASQADVLYAIRAVVEERIGVSITVGTTERH